MKKYVLFLFVLALACSDDKDVLSDHPPFDDYRLYLSFSHTPGTSAYAGKDHFLSTGELSTSVHSEDYHYYNEAPENVTLKVTTSEANVFRVEISGVLGRLGTQIPESYIGNPELWNSIGCNYKLVVECNTSTEQVLAATLDISSDKFRSTQDLTSTMSFSNFQPTEDLWVISTDPTGNADVTIDVWLVQ